MLPSFVTRLREVAGIVQGRASRRPLLATPTDTQGWVDADVLLARYEAGKESGAPFPVDLTQALLRVPPEQRARVVEATGGAWPRITDTLRIEWHSRGSETLKADGSPQWVWWHPEIQAEPMEAPSATQPALIPSGPLRYNDGVDAHALVCAELGLAHPASTLPLTAANLGLMNVAASDDAEHRAAAILRVLATHPGAWRSETAQLLALGMAAKQAGVRAQAVEVFAAAIPPRGRGGRGAGFCRLRARHRSDALGGVLRGRRDARARRRHRGAGRPAAAPGPQGARHRRAADGVAG